MASATLQGSRRGSRSTTLPLSRTLSRSTASLPNLEATQNRLRDILLGKEVQDTTSGGRRAPTQTVDPGLGPVGEGSEDGLSVTLSPGQLAGVSAAEQQNKGSYREGNEKTPPSFGDDRENKEAFIAQICGDNTRADVQEWVSRIYEMRKKQPAKDEDDQHKGSRRHPNLAQRGRAMSASGNSDTTNHTGTTSALMTAGGSIGANARAPSLISAESMIVHPGQKLELLSTEERLRAYLRNEIPELTAHVNKIVAKRAEEVRREIDEELVEKHLLQMRKMQVFDKKANFLRWQHLRRITLQKRLDKQTPFWMLEAVQSWGQKTAMKTRPENVGEEELVFEYLTKRAAQINSSKLANEIPIFQPLRSSYTLPRMWRDKYLEMF